MAILSEAFGHLAASRAGLSLEGIAGRTVNLQLRLARASAVVLLLLAASPYTAPFAVCDITGGPRPEHPATRHLTHAGAVVRPAAKVTRQPMVIATVIARRSTLLPLGAFDGQPDISQPAAPARHLVLRV
jgi:hypothetical protein